jgi:DNA modification methylase
VTVTLFNEDCITGMQRLADDSVRLLVTSIPFGALFSYSHKPEDVGNTKDGITFIDTQFGLTMRFWFEQVVRVMSPGCNVAIHVQQLNTTTVQHGFTGLRDFRGAIIDMARKHGLNPHGEVAIPKNPQIVAQRRKLHSLLFVTGARDSRKLAPANNDYVLFFQKPGDDGVPVRGLTHRKNPSGQFTQNDWIRWARGVWETPEQLWDGMQELDGYAEALGAVLAEEWMFAPVWDDIIETDVLENWRGARDSDEEKHVCPLQLEVVRRCVRLYTNPGDLVIDPFIGIGTTAVVCDELGRDCQGWELKDSYHAMAERNVERRRVKESAQMSFAGAAS